MDSVQKGLLQMLYQGLGQFRAKFGFCVFLFVIKLYFNLILIWFINIQKNKKKRVKFGVE